jgi:hypothetical protein
MLPGRDENSRPVAGPSDGGVAQSSGPFVAVGVGGGLPEAGLGGGAEVEGVPGGLRPGRHLGGPLFGLVRGMAWRSQTTQHAGSIQATPRVECDQSTSRAISSPRWAWWLTFGMEDDVTIDPSNNELPNPDANHPVAVDAVASAFSRGNLIQSRSGFNSARRLLKRQLDDAIGKAPDEPLGMLDAIIAESDLSAYDFRRSSRRWGRSYYVLGLPAVVLATLAGATGLASTTGRIPAAIVALISACLGAALSTCSVWRASEIIQCVVEEGRSVLSGGSGCGGQPGDFIPGTVTAL